MYYGLVYYPNLDKDLARSIDEIRQLYDPTAGFIKPHITVVFPVPGQVGESQLAQHFESVLCSIAPFEVRLSDFYTSDDHWLFLVLGEGKSEIKELYRSLYTGLLAEYRRDDIEFVPHLGLGLFIKEDSTYDWDNPQAMEFDSQRYVQAKRLAEALPLGSSFTANKLHFVRLSDEIIEWATGRRARIPDSAEVTDLCTFRIG